MIFINFAGIIGPLAALFQFQSCLLFASAGIFLKNLRFRSEYAGPVCLGFMWLHLANNEQAKP